MPLYKKLEVWTLVLSLLALALSQLPPISQWLRKGDVNVDIGTDIGVPTTLGVPGLCLSLDIQNNSNRLTKISNLEIILLTPSHTSLILPASSFSDDLSSNGENYQIGKIKLVPGDSWSHLVTFSPDRSLNDEDELNSINSQLSESIFEQSREQNASSEDLVEADPIIVTKAKTLFDKHFNLERGDYLIEITGLIDGRKNTLGRVRFTLFEQHIKTLRSQSDELKYGVFYPIPDYKGVWVKSQKTYVEQGAAANP